MKVSDPDGTSLRQRVGLIAGPLVMVAFLVLPAPAQMPSAAWRTAAVASLMAVWWITEAVPIAATALIPLALFPLFGIVSIAEAAHPYADPVIFLFMGGFMIAAAVESSGLHRRVALAIIRAVGTKPSNMVGGFMIATALLSMWVSNTATVVLMLPMAISVLRFNDDNERGPDRNLAVALLLGTAYAASIGGLATLIGTPPNALLAGFISESYGVHIGFGQWMLLGVPLVLIGLPTCWYLLVKLLFPLREGTSESGGEIIRRESAKLGPLSRPEIIVGAITSTIALTWIFRPLLGGVIPGISDAGIAIVGAMVLFALPVRRRPLEFLLDWERAEKLPWGVLVLFGGGLSLASAIEKTGLAKAIGAALSGLSALPLLLVIVCITTVIIFLTELTSNTATAATFLPIVASFGVAMSAHPLLFAVPAALASSCAFMLPVATPPNAIVYGSGRLKAEQMIRAGIWLNILFVFLITIAVFALVRPVFGIP